MEMVIVIMVMVTVIGDGDNKIGLIGGCRNLSGSGVLIFTFFPYFWGFFTEAKKY